MIQRDLPHAFDLQELKTLGMVIIVVEAVETIWRQIKYPSKFVSKGELLNTMKIHSIEE